MSEELDTSGWNLLYTNSNPNPNTVCPHCKQWIGDVFEPGNEPVLPMHPGCFCSFFPTREPPTFPDRNWAQWFANMKEASPQSYRVWVQRAAWYLRKNWPLGTMEALRADAERYNENEYEPRPDPQAAEGADAMPDIDSQENLTATKLESGKVLLESGTAQTYDAVLVSSGYITCEDGTDSNVFIPADVLQTALGAGLFDSLPHYVDHPDRFGFGWRQAPSVKDLAGITSNAYWDANREAVCAKIRLYDTEAGQLLNALYSQITKDRRAGKDVPPTGLSIVAFREIETSEDESEFRFSKIVKVASVDAVYEPGAAGYIKSALSAIGGSKMPEDTTAQESEQQPGDANSQQAPTETAAPEAPEAPEAPDANRIHTLEENIGALQTTVEQLHGLLIDQEEETTVQGMGDAPRQPALYGGWSGLDRLEQAVEAMLSGTRPPDNVRPLSGIRELYMLLSGDYELTGRFQEDQVYLANVTTSTMAGLVANRLNKIVVNMFQSYDRWWSPAVTARDFNSLQDIRWITLGGVGELPTVAEGAAYSEMSWDDQTETDAFVKKGGYLGITLETIDKDDTARVMAAPRALAQSAWLTLGKSIAGVLTANSGEGPAMSDGNNLFDNSNHSNFGSTALSYAAWKATQILMMKYTEINSGERLGALTRPRLLWVPIDLEDTAIEILAAGEGEIGSADYHTNPDALGEANMDRIRNARQRVITVPFWTNTGDWVAQANPNLYPGLGLGFRYGRTPEIFSVADPRAGLMFTNDTMPIKVRFFYAVGPTDYRAWYKHNV